MCSEKYRSEASLSIKDVNLKSVQFAHVIRKASMFPHLNVFGISALFFYYYYFFKDLNIMYCITLRRFKIKMDKVVFDMSV